jgi:mono/diheme cytochrome c family protein
MFENKASTPRWMGVALGAVLAACGTADRTETSLAAERQGGRSGGGSTGGGGGSAEGAALYAASCAGCHGALASSGVAGASSAAIAAAIAGNVGGMGSLSFTTAQLDAISLALGGTGGGGDGDDGDHDDGDHDDGDHDDDGEGDGDGDGDHGGGGSAEGAALYQANCVGCHGALASSNVRGESAEDIAEAIAENEGGMGSLTLSMAELESIAAALGGGGGDDDGGDDAQGHVGEHGDRLSLARRASHSVGGRALLALR